MRRALLAAALLTPALAPAQATTTDRTFAGCNLYVCATADISQYVYPADIGGSQTTARVDLTLLAPLFSGAFTQTMGLYFATDAFGQGETCEAQHYLDDVFLVGHAAGDVVGVGGPGCDRPDVPPVTFAGIGGSLARTDGSYLIGALSLNMTETPEPAPVVLMLGGLAVLGAVGMGRRKAA